MATALTQADLDKLDKAIVLGVKRVTYSTGTVEYQTVDDMMKARDFAAAQIAGATSGGAPMTSHAEFHR